MTDQIASARLGMLTPSSNTVLEPVTAAMLSDLPDVTAHFARLQVLKISMEADALSQFTAEPMLAAADQLAEAHVQSICWNGTSSGWLGFETDRTLIAQIEARTEQTGARRIAFVTPYLPEIQAAIVANYQSHGFDVLAERHLNDPGNYSFATYSAAEILDLCRAVAADKPDAIAIFCTNFRGAGVAETIEAETGIPVYDSVSTALWKSMQVAGANPARVRGWGRIFDV